MKNKFISFFLVTIFYFIMLCMIYMIHINFFSVSVILYDGALDAMLALLLTVLIFENFKFYRIYFIQFERVLISMLLILSGFFVVLTIPTIIDRSLSFYLLEKIQREGGGVVLSNLNELVATDYLTEYRVIDMRVTEQLKSGTIYISGDCVRLTTWGEKVAIFSSFFRKNFLAKKRLINNNYSDELTRIDSIKSNNHLNYPCLNK